LNNRGIRHETDNQFLFQGYFSGFGIAQALLHAVDDSNNFLYPIDRHPSNAAKIMTAAQLPEPSRLRFDSAVCMIVQL
jgi:hypothetical protein